MNAELGCQVEVCNALVIHFFVSIMIASGGKSTSTAENNP